MLLSSRVTFFAQSELELMKARVFELLEHRGVKMDHPEVLELLDKAGAGVDFDNKMVRFPKVFLEEQISRAPTKLRLAGRNGENPMEIPRDDGTFHTRTNTGAQSWIDLETGKYRRITASDVVAWARLADRLEQISICAFPVPSDVPTATPDVHALNLMLQNTRKHVWVQPYTQESVDYLIDLAMVAAGGEQALRADPPVSFITCSLTPLEFKRMDGLRKSAAFSQARYDDTRQQVRIAEAGLRRAESAVASARADLDLAEINLRDAEIKAPYAGVVTERLTEAGAYVQSGDPVIRMIGDQLLELEADVPFQNLAGLEPGVEVGVALDDGTRHSAVVRAILPSENPLTRTRMVRFVPNIVQARRALAHDQSVTLQIPIGPERQVLSVHKDAVIIQRDQNMVFVALGDEAQARPVVLGEAVGSRFEVRDGLDAGDLAVVRGNERLRPGDKIRIAGGAS